MTTELNRENKKGNRVDSVFLYDGEFWNGEIYGRVPNGSRIFLTGEKIVIYCRGELVSSTYLSQNGLNQLSSIMYRFN